MVSNSVADPGHALASPVASAKARTGRGAPAPTDREGRRGEPQRAGREAALGTSRIEFPHQDHERRRDRYRRRSQSARWLISDAITAHLPEHVEEVEQGVFVNTSTGELHTVPWVRPPRPARCSWRIGENVAVHSDGQHAHFSGTERCGSVWSCPVCASVIRAERSREITQAVEAHQAQGGAILFVTLTLRHRKADHLRDTLDTALTGWQHLLRGRAWVGGRNRPGMKERFDVQGYVRATEITYGAHGWHPHIHALIFTGRALTDTETESFGDELHSRWAAYAVKKTGRAPTRTHGIDVQRVDTDGKVLGQYLGKLQDEAKAWGAGAEMARSDVKHGHGSSVTPFQFLDSESTMPAPTRRRLWGEYVAATKGRRAITWSRGLKETYEVGDRTDEEILDDTESAPAQWLAEKRGYDHARRHDPIMLAFALEAAEREDWEAVAQLLPGRRIQPKDVEAT